MEAGLYKGIVVWCNNKRGYGFISIEDEEIFIHRTALEKFGLVFLHSGDEITVVVAKNKDGEAITEIRSVARKAPELLPEDTEPEENEVRGVVKFFNPSKGYGFIEIKDHDMQDVFIHIRTLQACGLFSVSEGQKLLLHVSDDGKGPQATEVRVLASK